MTNMSVAGSVFTHHRPYAVRRLEPWRRAALVWMSLAAHLAAQATTIYIDAYDQPASNGSTTLEVVGSPGSYGAVSPPYGVTNGLETGDTLLLAPASGTGYTNLTDTFRVCCTGLVVSLVNPDSGLVTNTSPVITSFPYNYSHAGMARAEWLWRTENGIKVKVTTGGTVSTSLAWSADPAETLTITATPTAPAHFLRWIGDVPAELAENQTITLDFSQPRSVGAVFSTELAFHVATTGDDGTGTGSEAVPFASITYAIEVAQTAYAVNPFDTLNVVVHPGAYTNGHVAIDFPVTIRSRDGRGSVTLVSTVVGYSHYDNGTINSAPATESFFYLHADGIVLEGLIFREKSGVKGARAVWARSRAEIRDCAIVGWSTPTSCIDGVVGLEAGSVMTRCSVINCSVNSATGHFRRGAVFCYNNAFVDECVITNNTAGTSSKTFGSGICATGSGTVTVRDTLVAKCKTNRSADYTLASWGGAITCESAGMKLVLENVTLADCQDYNGYSVGGLNIMSAASVACTNSVFYGNSNKNGASDLNLPASLVSKCEFVNCAFTTAVPADLPGSGNVAIDTAPFPGGGDYVPQTLPLIDGGTETAASSATNATDLAGNPRFYDGGPVDIGCFECHNPAFQCAIYEPDTDTREPADIAFNALVVGAPAADVTFTWTLTGTARYGGPVTVTDDGAVFQRTLAEGVYELSLEAEYDGQSVAAANSRQIVVGEAVVDLAIVEPDDIEAENSTNVTFTASLSGYGTEGSCFVWKLRSAGAATVTDDTCGGSFTRTLNPGFYNISLSAVLPNSRVVVADSSRSVLVTDGTDKTYLLSDFDYGVAVPAAIPSVPGTPVSSCAVAAEGYMFIRWSGDLPAEVVDPTNPELNFTADGSSVIKPVFGRVVNVNVAEPADESAAGNDESGDGSISAPYATVTRALQHARDALSAGLGPSVIALGDGTYSMIGNTVIDTPVRITALSGVRGSVTFSGSVIGQSHYDNGSVAGNQPGEALFYIDTDICVFDTLVIRWSGLYSGGRAVWARRGAVVRNCVIDGWTTKDCCADGVIALCDGSVMADSSVVNCTVKSLTGHYRRGGVFCQDGAAVVNCVITNNVASGSSYSKASALCAYGTGDFLVRNTLVAKCRCYCSTGQGNTIMSESAGVRLRLENVTLAECSILHSGSPAGLYIANSTSVACTNCVFHGSRNLDGASNVAFAGDVVKAKCTFGRCAFEIAIPDGIAGHNYVCAADDFKDLAATPQDYTPHVASRLVSKGARLPWMTTSSQDILGRPRLVGTPDIGAFECQKTAHTLIWLR